jgi:hypothetical protein
MYVCENDRYCPAADTFETVEEFLDMCRDCFGTAPKVRALPDGRIVDDTGAIVLRELA